MENVTLVTVQKHIHSHAQELATSGSQKMSKMMMQKKNSALGSGSGEPPSMGVRFVSAGLAACAADLVTFPLDTAKVRLQIQGEGSAAVTTATARGSGATLALAHSSDLASTAASSFKYRGIVGTLCTISREEGVRAMYNGLVPGLQRQMCFGCVRIGLYDSVKQFYINIFTGDMDKGSVSGNNIGLRILAGMTTGGAAVLCAQPTDVVKVRFQAATGVQRYKGCLNAYRTIAMTEGVRGLWKGTLPNIARNCIVNACELVSYDLIKEAILRRQVLTDNMPCHFVSAFGAGFCTTVIASPVDVVKTRFMNSNPGVYRGASHCAMVMFKEGGVGAFYKGFMPSFVRLGSWNVVMFVTFEQMKRLITNMRAPDASKLKEIKLKSSSPSRYI